MRSKLPTEGLVQEVLLELSLSEILCVKLMCSGRHRLALALALWSGRTCMILPSQRLVCNMNASHPKANQTVLVTAASGCIVEWISQHWLEAGHTVHGTVREPSQTADRAVGTLLHGMSQ